MKTIYLRSIILSPLLCIIIFCSCKKSSSGSSGDDLSGLSGNWQTTVWGGPNDTARSLISNSGTGTLTYLSSGAMTTNFSVNEVIFTGITSTGTGVYSCTGSYRYTLGGNSMLGSTKAIINLQNNNSVFFVHYAEDASTGITPPDYYWYKL